MTSNTDDSDAKTGGESRLTAEDDLSVKAARTTLWSFMCAFATLTVLTQLSQWLGISFRTHAFLAGGLAPVAFVGFSVLSVGVVNRPRRFDFDVLGFLFLLGAAGATLALVCHRPDADDFAYTPNAVYHLLRPGEPMDFKVHFYVGAPPYLVSAGLAFEYGQAAVAYLCGLSFINVYYCLGPAVVGFLIPVATYVLIAPYCSSGRSAIVSVVITLGILLLMGETHRTFGNFGFTRAFQGKTFFLAIALPSFVAAVTGYISRPGWRWAIGLCVTSVAAVGATSSALVFLPLLFLCVAAGIAASGLTRGKVFHTAIAGVLGLAYPVAFALLASSHNRLILSADSPLNTGWPMTLAGYVGHFIDVSRPVTPVVVVSSTIASLMLARGCDRIFLVGWLIAVGCLGIIVEVFPNLILRIAPASMAWRLVYLCPFPFALCLAVGVAWDRSSKRFPGWSMFVLVSALVILVLAHMPSRSTSIFRDRVEFGWPGPTVERTSFREALQFAQKASAGVTLAPPDIAGYLAMIDANHPQLTMGIVYDKHFLSGQGLIEEAALRTSASMCVAGDASRVDDLILLVHRQRDLVNLIVRSSLLEVPAVRQLIEEGAWRVRHHSDGWVLVIRDLPG